MSLLRSPVAQFLLAGLLLIAGITAATGYLAGDASEEEALVEARRINAVLARSVAGPSVRAELLRERTGALDRFDRIFLNRLLVGEVERINIWTEAGRLVYSSDPVVTRLIGQTFDLGEERAAVLADGGTGSMPGDPDSPENLNAASPAGQVQIFTRTKARNGTPLLLEGYYEFSDIEQRQDEIFGSFRWITVGALIVLVLLALPMLLVLTRRLTSGAQERERLLHTAIDASDAERRRIARDLHDGVVQDLAGAAFSLSAMARDPGTPDPLRGHLQDTGTALRSSLTALRSLLAEIHPPELHSAGLPAALGDLIAPASAAGVQASVSVEGAEGASDTTIALVWRVAQEAVRNSLRHADATTLAVTVAGHDGRVTLEVVDDGTGFDPTASLPDPSSFGLRGLRSLVSESGGTLEVRSSPGEGTTVRLEVDAR